MEKLITIVDDYIVKPHIVEKRARLSHYPSQASALSRTDGRVLGKCHRATWYDWKGLEPTNPIDARGMWTFAFGSDIERMYTEYFKQLGVWAANNIKWYNAAKNISGEIDIIVFGNKELTPEGWKTEKIGVELKTAYGYSFQKNVLQAPKPENVMQCMLYLDHWKEEGITEWRLIYHARDTHEKVEYVVRLEKDEIGTYATVDGQPYKLFYLEDIYARYEKLGKFVIEDVAPPRDFTYGFTPEESQERLDNGDISKTTLAQVQSGKKMDSDWQCLYCNHLDRCWAEKREAIMGKR